MNTNLDKSLYQKYSIAGRVQGVGMRYWVQENARRKNLTGWVKNETDQTVTALFFGDKELLADIPNWLVTGPRLAKITNLDKLTLSEDDVQEYKDFSIIY